MRTRIDRVKFATELARQDMTLVKLSSLIGITRVTLSNIKGGKTCSKDTAERIAKGLNVPLKALLED